jgi:predicted dehydrogenase
MLGYAFMGRAHASAYQRVRVVADALERRPRLVAIAGRDERAVEDVADRYGFERWQTDWRNVVEDPEVELFDNCGPNHLHAEPTIAAARAGKHVLCEKPLGRTADESLSIRDEAERAGVQHMCAFNYRFVPAIRLARELLEAGDLGDVYHFRARYLQDWGATQDASWRFDRRTAGSGALGDLGAHVIDLARYLVGEVKSVSGLTSTFQPGRTVDDAFVSTAELTGGVLATLEATRLATGRKNALQWEINASRGSLAFDLERPNELRIARAGSGFTRRLVTEPSDPFMSWWWPPGHVIGWEHAFVHEIEHLLGAIAGRNTVAPHGATFDDGYRAAEICDAIARSAASGKRELVVYR